MSQQIIIARAYCDDHMQACYQAYNTATGRTTCITNYTDYTSRLAETGWVYTGHHSGAYTYARRMSQPLTLPLDWQMARESIDQNQDW